MRKMPSVILTILALAGSAAAEFTGTYETDRYGWCEMTVTLNPEGYYSIEWDLGTPGNVFPGVGIEAFGYLGVIELDDNRMAMFGGGDGELYGIWINVDQLEVNSECTDDASELVRSDKDIPGTYYVSGEDDLSGNPFAFKMTVSKYERIWEVRRICDDGTTIHYGAGILVGDVFVAGLMADDVKTICVLRVQDGELYGDWLDYRHGEEQKVKVGILEAMRAP